MAALHDDNDGNLDLFVVRSGGPLPSRLYRNDGHGNFVEATPEPIRSEAKVGLSSAWADFDNDGDLDMFFGGFDQPSRLYVNNGDGTFKHWAGQPSALANLGKSQGFWADYDNDGYLDLFLNPDDRHRLFRNLGDGNFQEILTGSLVNEPAVPTQNAAWVDYDGDGFMDLFVANLNAVPNFSAILKTSSLNASKPGYFFVLYANLLIAVIMVA